MPKFNAGDRVAIKDVPGQMPEFVGKTGRVVGTEKYGELFYRVQLDTPVYIEGVGRVGDDIWTARFMRRIR